MMIKNQRELWHELFKGGDYVENYPAEQVIRFLMRYKKNKPDTGKLLDLGCGVGRHSILAAEIGFDTFAMDIVSSATDTVTKKANSRNLSINCNIGSMEKLPYEDNFFDIVISFGVFDHVLFNKAKEGIKEIKRVLKKGGLIYFKLETAESPEMAEGQKIEENTIILARDCERDIIQHYFSKEEAKELFQDFTIKNFDKEVIYNEMNNKIIISRWHIIAENKKINSKLKNIFIKTLGIPGVQEDFSLQEEDIDSFKKLLLLTTIEKEFNVEIDLTQAVELTTYQDYFYLLKKKGIKDDEI